MRSDKKRQKNRQKKQKHRLLCERYKKYASVKICAKYSDIELTEAFEQIRKEMYQDGLMKSFLRVYKEKFWQFSEFDYRIAENLIYDYFGKRLEERGLWKKHFPIQCFHVFLHSPEKKDNITIHIDGLRKEKSSYYSCYGSVLEIEDKKYQFAYSSHALERLQERSACDMMPYMFPSLFHYTLYDIRYVPMSYDENSTMVSCYFCYDLNIDNTESILRLAKCLNAENKFWLLVGYCPTTLTENGFAHANTFLKIGMKGTPERETIKNEKDDSLRHRLLSLKEEKFSNPDMVEFYKYLQDNGHAIIINDKNIVRKSIQEIL